jgi:hypothetical protein
MSTLCHYPAKSLKARPSMRHSSKELEYSLLIGHNILNCGWEVIFSNIKKEEIKMIINFNGAAQAIKKCEVRHIKT